MSDPIKPPGSNGPDAVGAADGVTGPEATESTGATFEVESSQQAAAAQPVDPLQRAIAEVATDIRAGVVPDAEAATDAVIIRLVNLRYGHLGPERCQKLIVQLHGLLQNDPRFQARIEQLLATATERA